MVAVIVNASVMPAQPAGPLDLSLPPPWCTFYRARLGNLARSLSGLDSDRLSMTSLITAPPAYRSLPAAFPPGPHHPPLSYPFHADTAVGSLCGIRVPHKPPRGA
ncbi:unnamed protein product [Lasius platythorax]|uniref:Uncharacterized protein n=1 Tax=Lasius platythorax TaxID=488582 RepID=A0AAV2NJK3_9HYME